MKVLLLNGLKGFKEVGVEDLELKTMQGLVRGYIEIAYVSNKLQDIGVITVVNEEGKLEGLEPTAAIQDKNGEIIDILYGDVLFVAESGEEFGGLNEDQINLIKEVFKFDPRMTCTGIIPIGTSYTVTI